MENNKDNKINGDNTPALVATIIALLIISAIVVGIPSYLRYSYDNNYKQYMTMNILHPELAQECNDCYVDIAQPNSVQLYKVAILRYTGDGNGTIRAVLPTDNGGLFPIASSLALYDDINGPYANAFIVNICVPNFIIFDIYENNTHYMKHYTVPQESLCG